MQAGAALALPEDLGEAGAVAHQAADFRSIDYQKEFVDDLSSLPSKRAQILKNALHTLIHQRRLTQSCGGLAPTAERTMDPARIFTESLTPRPELENTICQIRTS
jgi:hypothetical protein